MSTILQPWYHGARAIFDDWALRRRISAETSPFHVQAFVSLTATPACARMHTGERGRICTARLRSRARVIDLRGGSEVLRAGWDALRRSPLGRDHECARRFEDYVAQCRSGLVLRYLAPRDRLPGALQARLALASAAQVDPAHRDQVMFDFKDFLQRWIETVILPYRDLGYDAVVCNEREGPVSICTQLFVFDPAMLTPPEWLDPDQPRID